MSVENEEEALPALTLRIAESVSTTIKTELEGCTYEPSSQCAALFEASLMAALRVAVGMGCPWQEAMWAIRHTTAYLEGAHVEALREQMVAKVGAPQPGEEHTVPAKVEEVLKSPLIEIPPTYTPRSE